MDDKQFYLRQFYKGEAVRLLQKAKREINQDSKPVNVTAKVGAIVTDKTNTRRIVLEDVVVDGKPFRDHAWIKWSKRFKNVKCGDTITATAEVREYLGEDLKPKLGLGHFRNVKVVSSG